MPTDPTNEKRLDRIEQKLDKMADAIVSLARMEERMTSLFRRMDTYDEDQRDLLDRVEAVERSTGSNGQTLRFVERLFWIVVSGAVATAFWFMRS